MHQYGLSIHIRQPNRKRSERGRTDAGTYYDPLVTLLDRMADEGWLPPATRGFVTVASLIDEILGPFQNVLSESRF